MPAPRIFTPGSNALGTPEFRPQPRDLGPIFAITGITRDSTGVALPSCAVHLFRTDTDAEVDQTTSDGTTGVYTFPNVTAADKHYIVAYLAGSPDVSGTTLNTVEGAQTGSA